MRFFDDLNIDFLAKRKVAYIFSASLLLIGLISILIRGLELGIDFKGGTEIALQFEKPVEISEIRDDLNQLGLGNVEVKTFGGELGILIRTELQEIPPTLIPRIINNIESIIDKKDPSTQKTIVDSTSNSITYEFATPEITKVVDSLLLAAGFQTAMVSMELDNKQLEVQLGISDWVKENFMLSMPDNTFQTLKEERVGPKIGQELKRDAIIAVFLALLVILIYLGFRFKFVFALGAVLALFHDVMITLGLFSLLYGLTPFLNLEISISVVAAFLTLVGYSINDTVIVFDRVRENLKIHKTAKLEDNINRAINMTMRRTIVTSLTTLIVVAVLLFFGGEVLRGFAFTLFIGILIGTYSSIFVASPFVVEYAKARNKKIQF